LAKIILRCTVSGTSKFDRSLFSTKKKFKIIYHNNAETQHNTHTDIQHSDLARNLYGDAHTGTKLCTEFIQHNHLSTPQTVLIGWYKLLRPGCQKRGPEPVYVTNVFIIQGSIFFSTVQLGHFGPSPSYSATDSLSNLM
jgi:hypothetical protein